MKLILDRMDLKAEFENISCGKTNIEHFKKDVQDSIVAVGRAQFREYDGSNYNAIYPNEKTESE